MHSFLPSSKHTYKIHVEDLEKLEVYGSVNVVTYSCILLLFLNWVHERKRNTLNCPSYLSHFQSCSEGQAYLWWYQRIPKFSSSI